MRTWQFSAVHDRVSEKLEGCGGMDGRRGQVMSNKGFHMAYKQAELCLITPHSMHIHVNGHVCAHVRTGMGVRVGGHDLEGGLYSAS